MADSANGAQRRTRAAGRRAGLETVWMDARVIRWAVAVAVLWMGMPAPSYAAANKAPSASQSVQGAAQPAKKGSGKVTFMEAPSHEKPADRLQRLKRECKGRPNAGACLGHTR